MDAVLECAGLVRRFGDRTAVDGVSFSIGVGETYGLLGPNGAGKTTTISMICGLLTPDAGTVAVAGHPMRGDAVEAKAEIGLVPQDLALYEDLTARDNLRFFGRLQGLKGSGLADRLEEVLDVVGLADRADDRIETYSGGMKRRANIAVGLLHQPRLLVLDEPTVGVDPQSRNAILESVEALSGKGLSVLYTTHYMEEAERLCDRIGIIDDGRLVGEGTRRELIDQVGQGDTIEITGNGDLDALAAGCRWLDGVFRVDRIERGIAVRSTHAASTVADVVTAAGSAGVSITGLTVVEPDLEAVFLRLTGKALRDERRPVARTLRAAALIAANDLRRRLRNRAFLLQAFVGPLIMSVLISLAFGGGFGFDLKIGVVAEDRSELATELQRRLVDTEVQGVTFVAFDDVAAATAAVEDADVGAAIVVPKGFQASLATADPEPIGMVVDNDQSELYGAVARAVAEGFVARINAGRVATFALLEDGRLAPDAAQLAETDLPIEIRQRSAGDEVSPAASVGPGIGLLFLFLSVAIVARSLFEEKRLRVLDRVRAAPVSMGAVLLGKGIGVVVLSTVTMGVLWLATTVLLGASWGDPLGVCAIVLASSFAVAGIAAFIAGTVRSERSADLYATMVAFVLGILGGSLVPLSELPPGLLRLTLLTPNGWALRGFAELSAGDGTLVDVLPHLGVLVLWGVVAGGIGRALLPRRLGAH